MAEQATQVFVQGNAASVTVEPNETAVNVGHGFPIVINEGSGGTAKALANVTDSEPLSGDTGELWFNDSTDELKVRANAAWNALTVDDGHF